MTTATSPAPHATDQRRTRPVRRSRRRRAVLALLLTVAVTVPTGIWALSLGDYPLTFGATTAALVGAGHPGDVLVVRDLHLPRVLAALVSGAGLATSGWLLQRLAGNALAAPDMLGVNESAAFAVVLTLVAGGSDAAVPLMAGIGALTGAALLAWLSWRGSLGSGRLVLMGIALHTALAAATNLFVVSFPVELAQQTARWTVGSLYGSDWTTSTVCLVGLGLLGLAAFGSLRRLTVLELGEDTAAGLGLRVRPARLQLLALAAALAATGVALAGPVGFVALAVPHLARLLGGGAGPLGLGLTAALGGGIVLGCDLVAQYALGFALPVGAVTAAVGAPVLLALLPRWRRR